MPAVLIAKAPETWRLLHQLADAAEPEIRAAFLQAVAETVNGIVLPQVTAALERGDLGAAEALIPWDAVGAETLRQALPSALAGLVTEAAAVAAPAIGVSVAVSFDLVNPRAVAWAAAHAAALVTQVSEETRAAIRAVIGRAFTDGVPPREAAREIRALVGLTERDAGAVQNLRVSLLEAGRSEADVARLAQRYSDRLLNARGLVIARNETLAAANHGQRELWTTAREQGLIDGTEDEREWLVAADERLCPLCKPMKGRRAPLDGYYEHPTLGQVKGPLLHVQCRCSERLVPVRATT